jgi:hypothetical protein
MTTPLYFDPREPGSAALPAAVALACTLAPEAAAPSWHPQRAERVCAALFDVLSASQQERVLCALGWRPVLPAPTGHLSAHEDAISTGNEDAEDVETAARWLEGSIGAMSSDKARRLGGVVRSLASTAKDYRDLLESLLEIWEDCQKPQDLRAYLSGALAAEFDHVRDLLKRKP